MIRERAPLLFSTSGMTRKGPTSEHTQLPQKVHSCPTRTQKDRPLSKAISGPQIFLDLPLALKHNLGLLRWPFFIFTFIIITIIYTSSSFCVVCYTLQRSSPSTILFHSLFNTRRLREVPTLCQAQGHRAGEGAGFSDDHISLLLHRLVYSHELASCLQIQQNSSQLWQCRWGCKAYSSDDPWGKGQ